MLGVARPLGGAERLLTALILAMLTGCATMPSRTPMRDPAELRNWQAAGRIAVAGGEVGGSGSFLWEQHGDVATVRIHGPLGVGSLLLTVSGGDLRVETGDGQSYAAQEAQAELEAKLGAPLPTGDLRYWLLGLAAPGDHAWVRPFVEADDAATLLQEAWRIDYRRFKVVDGVRLPGKLTAVSGGATVRILIDRWKVPG